MVKTPPFHGVNVGSNPAGVTIYGRLAQLGERLPYKQDVGSSILSSPTNKKELTKVGSFFYGSMQKSVRSALSDLHAFARRKLLQMRCAAYALQAGCRQFDPVIAHQ